MSSLPVDLNTSENNVSRPVYTYSICLYCGVMEMKVYSINVKYIYSPGHACGWLEMTFMSFEILLTFVILCSIKQAGRSPSAAWWSSWKIFFGAVVWKMLLCIICIVNNPGYLKYLGKQEQVWQTDGGMAPGHIESDLWNPII